MQPAGRVPVLDPSLLIAPRSDYQPDHAVHTHSSVETEVWGQLHCYPPPTMLVSPGLPEFLKI